MLILSQPLLALSESCRAPGSTSINFKVISLIRPGIKPAGSGFEPAIFGFPDFSEWEAGALLIQPPGGGALKH